VAQTVNRSVTSTTLTIVPSVVNTSLTFTFTATVSPVFSGVYVPTGLVNFMDGTTVLGTGTLNGSLQATFSTTTALSVGTHSITAAYVGDTSFLGSNSAATSFTFETPANSQTVISGQPSGGVSLTPTGASNGATVTFSCLSISGTGITGSLAPSFPGVFAPLDVKGNPTQPFVSCYLSSLQVTAPATTTLTICTAIPAPSNCKSTGTLGVMRPTLEVKPRLPLYGLGLFLPGIALLGIGAPFAFGSRHRKLCRKSLIGIMGVLLGVSLLLFLAACGGGFPGNVQPPMTGSGSTAAGTYAVTVESIGSDGSVQIYSVALSVVPPG
jgi:hypothetical protein